MVQGGLHMVKESLQSGEKGRPFRQIGKAEGYWLEGRSVDASEGRH